MQIVKTLQLNNWIWIGIFLINLVRLSTEFIMGPMPQDMYYYFYSEHPDWAYFDHPAGIMVLLKSFTTLFGKSVLSIKLANYICTVLTQLVFYKTARIFLDKKPSILILLLLNVTFLFTVLSFNSTPDVPLMLCWTLSIYFLSKAIFKNQKTYWSLAGLAMGASFNCKYTAILLPMGLIAYLLFSKSHRKLLKTIFPYLTIAITLITYAPVIYWNMQNEFVSFLFQSSGRTAGMQFNALNPLGTVGSQIMLIGPLLILLLICFGKVGLDLFKKKFPVSRDLFFICFSLPIIGGFFLISFTQWVKVNWMMPGYITGLLWLGYYVNSKWTKWQVGFSLVVHSAFLVQILFYMIPIQSDDTWVGWDQLAKNVETLQESYPDHFVFSSDGYKTTAALNFYLEDKFYGKNILGQPALQYDYIGDNLNLLKGQDAIFIDSNKRFKLIEAEENYPQKLHDYFKEVNRLDPIIAYKGNRAIRKWSVYKCKSYKGL